MLGPAPGAVLDAGLGLYWVLPLGLRWVLPLGLFWVLGLGLCWARPVGYHGTNQLPGPPLAFQADPNLPAWGSESAQSAAPGHAELLPHAGRCLIASSGPGS